MKDVYGDVLFVGIDTDRQKYPIGRLFNILETCVIMRQSEILVPIALRSHVWLQNHVYPYKLVLKK